MRIMEDFGYLLTRIFSRSKAVNRNWPFVPGKYYVLDPTAPVAIATLGNEHLAMQLAESQLQGLCIAGKVETENIGIEKIVKNTISNPAIQFLICAGEEPPKHLTGATLLALFKNGIDDAHLIIGAPGSRPVLPNTTREEVDAFRRQVKPENMIGCTDVETIAEKVGKLTAQASNRDIVAQLPSNLGTRRSAPHISATAPSPDHIKLDKCGYFVINIENTVIMVEHYDYQERLMHVIEGENARTIYWTLINNGWIAQLDHAAYLGKELARAEYSIKHGVDFEQEGA